MSVVFKELSDTDASLTTEFWIFWDLDFCKFPSVNYSFKDLLRIFELVPSVLTAIGLSITYKVGHQATIFLCSCGFISVFVTALLLNWSWNTLNTAIIVGPNVGKCCCVRQTSAPSCLGIRMN